MPKRRLKPYRSHPKYRSISGISNSKSIPPNSDAIRYKSQCQSISQTSHLSQQTPPTPTSTPNPIIHSPPPPIPNSPLLLPHELHAPPPPLLPHIHTLFSSQTHPLNMPPHNLSTFRVRNLTPIIRIENRMSHSVRPLKRNRSCIVSAWYRFGASVSFPCAAKFELNVLAVLGVEEGRGEGFLPVGRVFGNGEAFRVEGGCGAGEWVGRWT